MARTDIKREPAARQARVRLEVAEDVSVNPTTGDTLAT